jgi:hypothetical protein
LELAIHGLRHTDHSRLELDNQRNQFRRAQGIFQETGIHATGFRSPYLRWNTDTVKALIECGFDYDSSQALAWDITNGLETSEYHRVLEFYGAQFASKVPALPRLSDGLVRIPYCLPDDEALIERLHLTEEKAIAEIWLAMLDRTYEAGELFTLGIHPERIYLCQEALRAVLERAHLLSPSVWIARLDEIANWYRCLGQASIEVSQEADNQFQIKIQALSTAAILIRSLEVESPTKTWSSGYRSVSKNEFRFHSNKRPFIGLSSDCPLSLQKFLKHQGYLIEISDDPQAYSFYLMQTSFYPEDERSLLLEIDNGDWPLVRLGRWPSGARSAMAVTGDIDAITLLDYGKRVIGR